MLNVKKDFPILKRKVNGKRLVYLDSAATSQKPKQVIEAEKKFYENNNANVHRAIHKLSEEATQMYESVRGEVAEFIGGDPNGIVFTKSTTEAINIVANSGILKEGDEVLVTLLEHHSNIVPWLAMKNKGIKVVFSDITSDGRLNVSDLLSKINKNTKLIALTHVSNSLGTINDIENIMDSIASKALGTINPYILVDAAQAVGHLPVTAWFGPGNVHAYDIDFLVFSAHKMFGPTGVGVLHIANRSGAGGRHEFNLRQDMEPLIKGGDMIKEVTTENVIYSDGPQKFEGGTQNIAGVIGLGEAIKYIKKVGIANIMKHDKEIVSYALKKLSKIEGITIYGPREDKLRSGSIAFNLEGIHSHDVAQILSNEGIMIRSGNLCTQPLMRRLGIGSICRASFHIYNDKKDVDALVKGLMKVKKTFKK